MLSSNKLRIIQSHHNEAQVKAAPNAYHCENRGIDGVFTDKETAIRMLIQEMREEAESIEISLTCHLDGAKYSADSIEEVLEYANSRACAIYQIVDETWVAPY